MPIYEYECASCHHEEELLQKISDPKKVECPACHKMTFERQVSPTGFQLKGSGWYVTDFKDKPKPHKSEEKPVTSSSSEKAASSKEGSTS